MGIVTKELNNEETLGRQQLHQENEKMFHKGTILMVIGISGFALLGILQLIVA